MNIHANITEQIMRRARDMGLRPDEYFDLARIKSAKSAEISGKDPKKWEQVHEAERKALEDHAARAAQEGTGTEEVAKTEAPAAVHGFGGLRSRVLMVTLAVGALGMAGSYAFNTLTGDDPNNAYDNSLTEMQRFRYNLALYFDDQEKLVFDEIKRIRREADLLRAKAEKADAERQLAFAESRNAPAVDMSDGFMTRPTAKSASANGALIGENIKSLFKEGYLKRWEAKEIALKWEDTTKSPVERSQEFSAENVASAQEMTDFRSEAQRILENDTVGRSPEAASYVAEKLFRER